MAAESESRPQLLGNGYALSNTSRQSAALNAVFYDRAVSPALKGIILDPKTAKPVVKISGVSPSDDDFDEEKKGILAKALGVQGILAVEGPPGTGKTKLIAEIVVQWLKSARKVADVLGAGVEQADRTQHENLRAFEPRVRNRL